MVSYAGTDLTPIKRRAVTTIEHLLTRKKIHHAVDEYNASFVSPDRYFRTVARILELDIAASYPYNSQIPKEGPLLVVANHPFGIIDGLTIAATIEKVRSDLKIIIWDAIDVPAPERHFIPLDLTENSFTARKQNAKQRRNSVKYLKDGGAILIFPSGSAERSSHPLGKPSELPWTPLAGRLALESSASVLPAFVGGHNSRLFHAASFLGDTVRRGLFLHETARLMGSSIAVTFSPVISSSTIVNMDDANAVCDYLRKSLYWEHKVPSCNPRACSSIDDNNSEIYLSKDPIPTQSLSVRY